jgi:hypothetical protein
VLSRPLECVVRLLHPPKEPCVTFSITRLNRVPSPDGVHRAGSYASRQACEPQVVVPHDQVPEVATAVAVLLRDEPREAFGHELVEVVKRPGRVAVGEVAAPSRQEPIETLHDLFHR